MRAWMAAIGAGALLSGIRPTRLPPGLFPSVCGRSGASFRVPADSALGVAHRGRRRVAIDGGASDRASTASEASLRPLECFEYINRDGRATAIVKYVAKISRAGRDGPKKRTFALESESKRLESDSTSRSEELRPGVPA